MKQKFYSLFAAAALVLGMNSCSNDEVVPAGNTVDEGKGVTAYLKVRIADAPGGTRAAADDFEQGLETEYKVESADFYFYDEKGIFVGQANAWTAADPDKAYDTDNADPNNIDYKSGTVIVLKGLKQKSYPKYMVTVCNKPDTFEEPAAGSTLDDMEAKLANLASVTDGQIRGFRNNFVMSTTSYKHDPAIIKPFVNVLADANFQLDPKDDATWSNANIVDIYVERLAAKVTVKLNLAAVGTNGNRLEPHNATNGIYKMDLTVAGEDNKGTTVGAEVLYVKFTNWVLNATSKHSYMVKHIDTAWPTVTGNDTVHFAWNDADRFRSYWGKSVGYDLYNQDNYNYIDNKDMEAKLLSDSNPALGESTYCAENTLSGPAWTKAPFKGATSVVIGVQLFQDEACQQHPSLLHYRGVLYTENNYKSMVLGSLNKTPGNLNYYVKTSAEDVTPVTYKQIPRDSVVVKNISGGFVELMVDTAHVKTLYSCTITATDTTFAEITNGVAELNGKLHDFNASNKVAIFADGIMRYSIPIKHLNTTTGDDDPVAGRYGIVRNHHYVIEINSLKGLGAGVYDPDKGQFTEDDPDIPDNPHDDPLYQVGATINVLSWRVVNQDGVVLN